jgi:hypothetical protein
VLFLKFLGCIQLNILPFYYAAIKDQIDPVSYKRKRSVINCTRSQKKRILLLGLGLGLLGLLGLGVRIRVRVKEILFRNFRKLTTIQVRKITKSLKGHCERFSASLRLNSFALMF